MTSYFLLPLFEQWMIVDLNASLFRGLRMLSLVLGSEITDASVAAIASTYSKLELLDLSGYVLVETQVLLRIVAFLALVSSGLCI